MSITKKFGALAVVLPLLALMALSALCRGDNFDDSMAENPLRPYNPNYVAVDSDHGESRVQFLMSINYDLTPFALDAFRAGPYRFDGLHFAYDGLYDFFLWNPSSQPVISRLQDPGLFFAFVAPPEQRFLHMEGFDLGWFHESNGETIYTKAEYDALYAQIGQDANDYVHRGWDYYYVNSKFTWSSPGFRFRFTPTLHLYDGTQSLGSTAADQAVFWKPGPPQYIYYYDGLRADFSAECLLPVRALNHVILDAEFRTGYGIDHFATHWSRRVTLTFKAWYLPIYVYYDNGYGPYISDYTTWSEGWGMGIRLW